jgi:hypothetical protein
MKMTTETLVALLADVQQRIAAGDSFEGNLSYTVMADGLRPGEYEVAGGYRVGNSEGQGGYRLLQPPAGQDDLFG